MFEQVPQQTQQEGQGRDLELFYEGGTEQLFLDLERHHEPQREVEIFKRWYELIADLSKVKKITKEFDLTSGELEAVVESVTATARELIEEQKQERIEGFIRQVGIGQILNNLQEHHSLEYLQVFKAKYEGKNEDQIAEEFNLSKDEVATVIHEVLSTLGDLIEESMSPSSDNTEQIQPDPFDGIWDKAEIERRQKIVDEARTQFTEVLTAGGHPILLPRVRLLEFSDVRRVYEYLIRNKLINLANLVARLNTGSGILDLRARLVHADIRGGFNGNDGVINVQPGYDLKGIEYKMDEIFYHELLACLGLPHDINEKLTLMFRANLDIPPFIKIISEYGRKLNAGKLVPVNLRIDRFMDPQPLSPVKVLKKSNEKQKNIKDPGKAQENISHFTAFINGIFSFHYIDAFHKSKSLCFKIGGAGKYS